MLKAIFAALLLFVLLPDTNAANIRKERTPQCWSGLASPLLCASTVEQLLPTPVNPVTKITLNYPFPLETMTWNRKVQLGYFGGAEGTVLLDSGSGWIQGQCNDPLKKNFDDQGYYCEVEELDCSENKDRPQIFDKHRVEFGVITQKKACDSQGCEISVTSITSFEPLAVNGQPWQAFLNGKGTYTGGKCVANSGNSSAPTSDPQAQEKPITGPLDCPATYRYVVVNGKGTCAWGDGGDKKTEQCQAEGGAVDPACSEGGSEMCKANPTAQACTKGTPRYCALNFERYTDPSCQPGTPGYCAINADHPSCVPGTDEFCATHVEDPQCQQKAADACVTDPNGAACKKAQDCAVNQNDPACKNATTEEAYCKQFPNDPRCVASAFSGSCGQAYNCKGDAIQCAIAKEQHTRNCQIFDESSTKMVVDAVLNGTDKGNGNLPGKPGGVAESHDLTGTFGTASGQSFGFGTGAQCPAPREVSIEVWGYSGTIEIPWTPVCNVAEMLAPLMLLLSTIAAARIAFGGVI